MAFRQEVGEGGVSESIVHTTVVARKIRKGQAKKFILSRGRKGGLENRRNAYCDGGAGRLKFPPREYPCDGVRTSGGGFD
jgi:hypothetical protein